MVAAAMNKRIDILTLADLPAFVASPAYKTLADIPISTQRAQSYAHHPSADSTDKVLYLAWEDKKLIGYRLLLPDIIYLNTGPKKIAWYSCLWVHPEYRRQGIARQLIDKARQDWQGQLAYQNPAPAAHLAHQQTGDFTPHILTGKRWYHAFHLAELWQRKRGRKDFIHKLWIGVDAIANTLIHPLMNRLLPQPSANDNYRIVTNWSTEAQAFITAYNKEQLFRRTTEEWQWMNRYPWIQEGPADANSKRYYFSVKATQYKHFYVELRNSHQLIGLLCVRLWNRHLDVLYFWGNNDAAVLATHFIQQTIRQYSVYACTVFHPALLQQMNQTHRGFAFSKTIKRHYYLPASWDTAGLILQPGDGDGYFT